MTQEEKQLLLKDLCSRLPYGVIARIERFNYHDLLHPKVLLPEDIKLSINNLHRLDFGWKSCKPYLRPMSSITEEENKTIDNISNKGKGFEEDEDGWIRCDSIHTKWGVWPDGCAKLLDYLNSIHVDYRGLIPMGLALEAPEDMYKTN